MLKVIEGVGSVSELFMARSWANILVSGCILNMTWEDFKVQIQESYSNIARVKAVLQCSSFQGEGTERLLVKGKKPGQVSILSHTSLLKTFLLPNEIQYWGISQSSPLCTRLILIAA